MVLLLVEQKCKLLALTSNFNLSMAWSLIADLETKL